MRIPQRGRRHSRSLFLLSSFSLAVKTKYSLQKIMQTIGIDMSKRSFHAAFDEKSIHVFQNTSEGIASFGAQLAARSDRSETRIGVEATGAYHLALCATLAKQGWPVVVINPLESHRFATAASIRTVKNDRKDAALIRQMVTVGRGRPWRDTDDTIALKALIAEREGLVAMRISLKLRAEARAAKQSAVIMKLRDSGTPVLAAISREIKAIDNELGRHAQETQRLLRTIPGVGSYTAAALTAYVGDIRQFSSPEKLVAYIGLDCRVFESGTSVKGKGYISKRGNSILRRALWNAAFVSRQKIPYLKAYFEKKRGEGKHYAVALCAVERKLVHLIWAVWQRGTPFQSDAPETQKPQ